MVSGAAAIAAIAAFFGFIGFVIIIILIILAATKSWPFNEDDDDDDDEVKNFKSFLSGTSSSDAKFEQIPISEPAIFDGSKCDSLTSSFWYPQYNSATGGVRCINIDDQTAYGCPTGFQKDATTNYCITANTPPPIPGDTCTYNNWGVYGTCGTDQKQHRARTVLTGTDCPGELQQSQDCTPPIDTCSYNTWGSWSACDATSKQQRTRTVLTGAACPGLLTESQACTPTGSALGGDCMVKTDCQSPLFCSAVMVNGAYSSVGRCTTTQGLGEIGAAPTVTAWTPSYEKRAGKNIHASINCGNYSTMEAIENGCNTTPACIGYTMEDNGATPHCLKSARGPLLALADHDTYLKPHSSVQSNFGLLHKSDSKCLDGGGDTVGLETCNGGAFQRWNRGGNGLMLKNKESSKCLDAGTSDGTRAPYMDGCTEGNTNQQWVLHDDVAWKSVYQNNKCLDSDGSTFYMNDCNSGNPYMNWFKHLFWGGEQLEDAGGEIVVLAGSTLEGALDVLNPFS